MWSAHAVCSNTLQHFPHFVAQQLLTHLTFWSRFTTLSCSIPVTLIKHSFLPAPDPQAQPVHHSNTCRKTRQKGSDPEKWWWEHVKSGDTEEAHFGSSSPCSRRTGVTFYRRLLSLIQTVLLNDTLAFRKVPHQSIPFSLIFCSNLKSVSSLFPAASRLSSHTPLLCDIVTNSSLIFPTSLPFIKFTAKIL